MKNPLALVKKLDISSHPSHPKRQQSKSRRQRRQEERDRLKAAQLAKQ